MLKAFVWFKCDVNSMPIRNIVPAMLMTRLGFSERGKSLFLRAGRLACPGLAKPDRIPIFCPLPIFPIPPLEKPAM